MGFSYFNITTKGPTQDDLVAYLTSIGRRAIVFDEGNRVAVIWDEEFNGGIIWRRFQRGDVYLPGMSAWEPLVRGIAREFDCVALAVEIFDSDVLYYELYAGDRLIDECVADRANVGRTSWYPMPPDSDAMLNNDHATLLCAAFGVPERQADVANAFRYAQYVAPKDRHRNMVNALDLLNAGQYMSFGMAELYLKAQQEEGERITYKRPAHDYLLRSRTAAHIASSGAGWPVHASHASAP